MKCPQTQVLALVPDDAFARTNPCPGASVCGWVQVRGILNAITDPGSRGTVSGK